ncbi:MULTISPECIES: DUF3558 domain-containing protein [Mycolicibacterium]|jgi:hypothetical protein|uniref:DUF3558 domain-containing protein n=1 Tax=Mycolicibacterium TaxID=1866885 RepID=UPI0007E9648C|nr:MULTISPECIES: DUF3558 domain-containing protein [Mycolicibacterium]NOP95957.1 DUF3558 domain-containing protein [Mycolicibacterium fortuitum]OBB02209.1 hypothetical protein A5665_17705 [Mycolicibacterium fortuitum]OBI62713.1 hypothetical protein A5667_08000 [Mycolicibacterium fortuitum]OBI68408.1 hypothetical protein A5666_27685 [Mycolicibacterium fortuitum]OBK06982.1 hypothetical protein A5637_01330 [Mycolicibacterium fortuitum]
MRRCVVQAAAVAVTAVVTVAGCSHTIDGAAQRASADSQDPDRSFGYVDDRCGLLADSTIQEILAADNLVRPYSGAVCQYVLSRKAGPAAEPGSDSLAMLDVIFSWFEKGSLERERAVARSRDAEIIDTIVERHQAFLARRDVTGASCSATASAGSGVISWWVQFRAAGAAGPSPKGDPCQDAKKLLSATLQSEL